MINDMLDLVEILSAAGTKGAEKLLASLKHPIERYKQAFKSLLLVALLVPLPFFLLGLFWKPGFFAYAGLAFGIPALGLSVMAGPFVIAIAAVFRLSEDNARRYVRGTGSLLTTALYVSLLFSVIPIYRNIWMFPLILVGVAVLGMSNAWLFQRKIMISVTTVVLLAALFSVLFPRIPGEVGRRINAAVEGILPNEPVRTQIACSDILSDTVRFFSGGRNLYWYYRDDQGSLQWFTREGRHPTVNAVLQPVSDSVIRDEKARCQMELRASEEVADAERRRRESIAEGARRASDSIADARRVQAQREAEAARLRGREASVAAALAEQRALEAAQRESQAIETRFRLSAEEAAASSTEWKRNPTWLEVLRGKTVHVFYSGQSAELAGAFAGRLQELGVRVNPRNHPPDNSAMRPFEIYYNHEDLRAATAIQASTVDLRRLSLTSDPDALGIIVWFP